MDSGKDRKGVRTYWYAPDLSIKNEPLAKSLLTYNMKKDRTQAATVLLPTDVQPNLVSSQTTDGEQMPILDVDVPFKIEPSHTPGHAHFYFDVKISWWRWVIFLFGCKVAGIIEKENFWWSLRRGGTHVRLPGVVKEDSEKPEYGWLWRKRS